MVFEHCTIFTDPHAFVQKGSITEREVDAKAYIFRHVSASLNFQIHHFDTMYSLKTTTQAACKPQEPEFLLVEICKATEVLIPARS